MFVLHYAPDNASLIVRIALEELGLPYRTVLVDRTRRQQDSEAYRLLNPTGLIPVLETPDGPIFETGAVLLWLSDSHAGLAPDPKSPARGDFLKWLFFTSNSLHSDMRMLFYPDRYAGVSEAVPAFSVATRARISGHLSLLDDVAADEPSWLSPRSPSILGIYLCCLLRWLALYPLDRAGWLDLEAFPALRRLAAETEVRPASTKAALAEGLGDTIFTKPVLACPPEGSAT